VHLKVTIKTGQWHHVARRRGTKGPKIGMTRQKRDDGNPKLYAVLL